MSRNKTQDRGKTSFGGSAGTLCVMLFVLLGPEGGKPPGVPSATGDWPLLGSVENLAGGLEAVAYDEGSVVDPAGALGFDGMTMEGTSLLAAPSLSESEGFTVCGWVNPSGLETNGFTATAPHTLFRLYDSTSTDQFTLRILDGKLNGYHVDPSENIWPEFPFTLNQWAFVAVVCDGESYTFYQDNFPPYVFSISSANVYDRLIIGALLIDGYRPVDGKMRMVKLFDNALDEGAIHDIRNREAVVNVADWPLMGSLTNRAGTLEAVAYEKGAVVDSSGSLDPDGMRMDGTSLFSLPSLTESQGFTVSGWVKPSRLDDGWSTNAPHTLFRIYNSTDGTEQATLRILDGELHGYHTPPPANILLHSPVATNEWNFVAVACGNGEYTFYHNDLPPQMFAVAGSNAYDRLMIGALNVDGYRPTFGKMRQVKLFDGALDETAVRELYRMEKPTALNLAGNLLTSGSFENTTIQKLKATWSFSPTNGAWRIDDRQSVEGGSSLAVTAGSVPSFASISLPVSGSAGEVVFGGWVSIKGSERARNALARVFCKAEPAGSPNTPFFVPDEPHYISISKEYRPDTQPTYFEHRFSVPVDYRSLRLTLAVDANVGDFYFDQMFLAQAQNFQAEWDVETQTNEAPSVWRDAACEYRVSVQAVDAGDQDILWADVDFSRFLFAYGERNPPNRGSVQVWAIGASQAERLDAVSDYALPTLGCHYPHNGLVRWRSRNWAKRYEIYFSPMGTNGVSSVPGPVALGAGEILNYPTNAIVPAWGSWAGYKMAVMDADGDGDWDLYSGSSDEGWFVCRNIGSNASPLFAPRTRLLATDHAPSSAPTTLWMDWDGDGDGDRIEAKQVKRGTYFDGAYLNLGFNENSGGGMLPDADVVDAGGTPVKLEDATWYRIGGGDFDNDGSPDIVVGTAMGTLELLLNRGKSSGKAVVEHIQVPFNLYSSEPYESGDMALKPVVVDWDGDGDDDIAFTAWQGFFWLLRNNGTANTVGFAPVEQFMQRGGQLATGDSVTPDAVDWDNDGDLDLIAGNVCGHINYFENIGSRTNPVFAGMVELQNDLGDSIHVTQKGLAPVQGPAETMWGYLSCQAWDVDADTDLDLVVNDSQGRLRWIQNTGTRSAPLLSHQFNDFTYDGTPVITPWRNRPGVADMDGDGRVDIYVLDSMGFLVRHERSGGSDASALNNKTYAVQPSGGQILINSRSGGASGRSQINAGDFDGDGDVDLLIGRPRDQTGENMIYCKNVGSSALPVFEVAPLSARGSSFVEWTGSAGHEAWHSGSPEIVDWNGDGTNELLTGVESGRFTLYGSDYFSGVSFPAVELLSVEKRNGQATEKIALDKSRILLQELGVQETPLQGLR